MESSKIRKLRHKRIYKPFRNFAEDKKVLSVRYRTKRFLALNNICFQALRELPCVFF